MFVTQKWQQQLNLPDFCRQQLAEGFFKLFGTQSSVLLEILSSPIFCLCSDFTKSHAFTRFTPPLYKYTSVALAFSKRWSSLIWPVQHAAQEGRSASGFFFFFHKHLAVMFSNSGHNELCRDKYLLYLPLPMILKKGGLMKNGIIFI